MKRSDFLSPTGRGLSRRGLLQGASAGVGASMLGALFPATSRAEQGRQHHPTLGIVKPALDSMPKAFSNDEFHRRWDAVRKRMKEAKLDCLIVPQHPHGSIVLDDYYTDADVNWLCGLPAEWVILPLEGKITVIGRNEFLYTLKRPLPGIIMTTLFADNSPDIELWDQGGGTTRRGGAAQTARDGGASQPIIDVLREKKMEHARIGVGSLSGVFRNTEGSVPYTVFDNILKALPQAHFESAVDILWQVKWVHSDEEIAAFEKVAEVSEAGLLAMLETAHPGSVNRDVWLAMYSAMLQCSGSRPQHLGIATQGIAGTNLGSPLPDVIEAGQILGQECSGCVLGLGTQVNHSVLIGSKGPADWPDAAKYCIDAFHALLDQIVPGKYIQEVADFYGKTLEKQSGRAMVGGVNFHFDGYGDLPRTGARGGQGTNGAFYLPGMVLDLKPSIVVKGTPIFAQFGDSVLVTEKGARRLGKRKMEIVNLT
jgi:Xaa-Pro aminopeptidase